MLLNIRNKKLYFTEVGPKTILKVEANDLLILIMVRIQGTFQKKIKEKL